MAAQGVNKQVLNRKGTNYPARMAGRTAEVRAVGAWVQPESRNIHTYYEAVHSAQAEERRIQEEREVKEVRLKQFQEDVKRRVTELARLKRQHELQKTYKDVEAERNIVRQTFHAAERVTPRKNRCYIRNNENLAIQQTAKPKQEPDDTATEQAEVFKRQREQLQQLHLAARRSLMSRRLVSEGWAPDDVPGGAWRRPVTDAGVSRVIDVERNSDVETIVIKGNSVTEIPSDPDRTVPKTVQFEAESETSEDVREYRIHPKSADYDERLYTTDDLSVHSPDHKQHKPKSRGATREAPVVVNPGILDEQEKQRVVKQRALYRRMFMDIEREQVKESLRRKEHRRKINQLKKAKESERAQAEEGMRLLASPVDLRTGETPEEATLREREQEEAAMREALELSHLRAQKLRESERYLEALRRTLQEKLTSRGVELPAMCACGTSLWDTNPDTCANNCVFYRNPKAYTKALQSLLASCDVA